MALSERANPRGRNNKPGRERSISKIGPPQDSQRHCLHTGPVARRSSTPEAAPVAGGGTDRTGVCQVHPPEEAGQDHPGTRKQPPRAGIRREQAGIHEFVEARGLSEKNVNITRLISC